MINKKTMLILLVGVIVGGLLVFNYQYTKTFEEAMNKSNISYNKILHTIETEKGKVVFYKHLDKLHVGLIEKTITGYDWVIGAGSESFSSDNDIEFGYSNIGKSNQAGSKEAFPLVTGTLMNEEIKEVQVVLRDEEPKKANIVSTDEGVFWYLFLDKQIDYTPEIIGLGNDGNIIYPIKDQHQGKLQEPLEGENVFDPKKINVGDKVQGLILTKIQVFEGTRDYPIDTLTANFKGSVILNGTMNLIEKDNEFYFEDLLLFKPHETSSKKLPISHHESPNRPMVFENQDDAISMLGIKPGESIDITIEIENYTINFLPTDALNSAKLNRVINEDVISLFPFDKSYNNEETISLNIKDEVVAANFIVNKYSDFGLYVPEILQAKDFEDGNEFYLNEGEFITLIANELEDEKDYDKAEISAKEYIENFGPVLEVVSIDELKKYDEYLGSKINEYEKEMDFFLFKHKDKNLIVMLTYNKSNRNKVLPIFLEVIKTIKYIPHN